MLAVYGIGWSVTAVVAAVIMMGATDYLFRFQDRGLRVICSLLVLAAMAWAGYRFLYLPLFVRLRDVDLALKLQRRFPGLEDRLVSAVEFLRQSEDDPLAGSAALRRVVIARTTSETEQIDFGDVLDRRPPIRATMASVIVCLVAAILLIHEPLCLSSRVALARLVNPFGSTSWPRKNHLQLAERVRRVARGQAFEIEVIDAEGARLPPEIWIHYRFENPDGSVASETEPMPSVAETAAARRENVTRPFSYRVTGGDDRSMRWIEVEVLEPPEIRALTIRLIPPKYTGWPPENSGKNIRALAGTRMQLAAATTKPLRSVVLCLEGGRRVPGIIADDGLGFTLPGPQQPALTIDCSGSYWFELTDSEGLSGGGERWEIRAVPDTPPSVTIELPASNVFVTPSAVVPVRVSSKDDQAIQQMALVYRSGDKAPESQPGETQLSETLLPLFTGPRQREKQPAGALSGGAELGDSRVVDYRWELAALDLVPGNQVIFHATAADYRPQSNASEPRRLIIITPEELQERIAGRQNQILAELARVLKMQRESRSQVEAIEIRLVETASLEQLDVDHLQAAELNQRQVNRILTSRSEGVPMHILALLADLRNNQVDGPDVRRRMEGLLSEIDRLQREHLALIGRELTAAIKTSRVALEEESPPKSDAAVAGSLVEAGKHQDAVIASLEQMLDRLSRWDDYRRFHREISQLLRDQEELTRRSAELGRHTLTKDLKDLRPQELADLKIVAGRQLELARQLDRIRQGMEQAAIDLGESDPLVAATVADAAAETARLAISGQMRTAGAQLRSNQIGQAAARQKQIALDLQEVLDILANRRQPELVRLVSKLIEAEADLADLDRRQQGVCGKLNGAAADPDQENRRRQLQRLAAEQKQIQKETERMARRLQRLLAEKAGRTANEAAGQMGQAGQCAAGGNCGGAQSDAAAAAKTLKKAREQLAERRLRAQAELAMEQLARLEDALRHLRRQQQNVIDETQRFEDLRQTEGRLTRAQTASLASLARLQNSLREETVRLSEKFAGAGAFQLALSGAGRDMARAAELLEQRDTGPRTQQAERHALGRLDLLLEALEPEEPDNPNNGGGAGAGNRGGRPQQGVQTLAELKLLKLLQAEINLRTRQLQEAAAATETLTEQQQREYALLSEEQGRLADLVLGLVPVTQGNPEDDPDSLPRLQPDEQEPLPEEEETP